MHTLYMKGVCIFVKSEDKDKNKKKNRKEIENVNIEMSEDTTKYGEWMASYFTWITPEEQKEKVKELNDMTNKEEKDK